MADKVTLKQLIGDSNTDDFLNFDITVIQSVLSQLASDQAIDIAHSEMLQQKALYAADILSEYLARMIKTVSFLESKLNAVRNKVSLEYEASNRKTTMEMKRLAGESDPRVEEIAIELAKAKGAKTALEKKYDLLIKSHHYWKDISASQNKGMVSNSKPVTGKVEW